jgi:hypothetical protein
MDGVGATQEAGSVRFVAADRSDLAVPIVILDRTAS